MIDLNDPIDIGAPSHSRHESDREEIRAGLLARLEGVLSVLFPAGTVRHDNFLIGDVSGNPGDSLEVVLAGEKAGLWTDRATGDGGDFFALIAAHRGIDTHTHFPKVLEAARELLGCPHSAVPARRRKEAPVDDLGPHTAKWDYFAADGQLIACVYRYDPPGRKKEFRPWDAQRQKMAPPDPRPLYNQPGMRTSDSVVLVEGEKCAQALIDTGVVATTAMHGANAPVEKTDWTPLAGKQVLIWPDLDKAGWDYALAAADAVLMAGVLSCEILMPPEDKAQGWDVADALIEGFDVQSLLATGPRITIHPPIAEEATGEPDENAVWATDDALALSFTRRYAQDWRYCAQWGKWLAWTGNRWQPDETLLVTHLMRHIWRGRAQSEFASPGRQARFQQHGERRRTSRPQRTSARLDIG